MSSTSMHAWEFARALGIAEKHGWTRFVSMQSLINLLYREEEREMPVCAQRRASRRVETGAAEGRTDLNGL